MVTVRQRRKSKRQVYTTSRNYRRKQAVPVKVKCKEAREFLEDNLTTEENYAQCGLLTNPNANPKHLKQKRAVKEKKEIKVPEGLPKKERHLTEKEIETITALMAKHGEDYDAMFWDIKTNVYQWAKGDIKRRIRLYQQMLEKSEDMATE